MNKTSPFTPGYGGMPPYLAGRESEQAAFSDALNRLKAGRPNTSIVMYGPRGMGKTVLLGWFAEQCREAGVIPISATPSASLRAISDIPKLLLPQNWLPSNVTLSLGNLLGLGDGLNTQWGIKDENGNKTRGKLADHLATACRKTPRALLLDEAHTLEDAETYRALLNTAQIVAGEAPFLLVLAGTPGLISRLASVGATYIDRAGKVGVGALSREAAADAIRIPLQNADITVQDDVLDVIVEDSQCYPFFLQQWGDALWHLVDKQQLTEVTLNDMETASKVIQELREDFYASRFRLMANNNELLIAADAVSQAFKTSNNLDSEEIAITIENGLTDAIQNDNARFEKARELAQELNKMDYIWYPPGPDIARPDIPSFMTYISGRYAERIALKQASGR
ncbi:MAG: ATP-binding protein [Pseudohongiellaceae bacterium]